MPDALVGSTGFVGSNLLMQTGFDDVFHSTDIASIRGRSYDLLVCAAAPAEKWKANRDPGRDLANLEQLMGHLGTVRVRHVVLISTVDVFAVPVDVYEDSPVAPDAATAYGRHRYQLEEFFRARFDTTCLRLPGLYGAGLKKNVIFDLLHGNALEAVCPDSVYQFYGLDRLWADVVAARRHGLGLVHLATEPVSVREVAHHAFDMDFENPRAASPARYDLRTRHAALFGGEGHYIMSRAAVLAGIAGFVAASRRERP
jgi:nucleoside-diphosphate-sugar epimerase